MKTRLIAVVFLILLIGIQQVLLAQREIVVIDSTKDGSIRFAHVNSSLNGIAKEDSKTFLKRVLKAENETQFYLYKVVTDRLGMVHEKYQQTFQGIKVEFSEFIIHKDKTGEIVSINGNFTHISEFFKIIPKLTFDESVKIAATSKNKEKFLVLDLPQEISVEKPLVRKSSKYELVIVKGFDNKLHLAYKTILSQGNMLDNFIGYIDCESGELAFYQSLVSRTNATGSAETMYNLLPKTITTDYTGSNYRLRETSRRSTGTDIRTFNFNRSPFYSWEDAENGIANATDFTDNDNNWTELEHGNIFQDDAALDAHWGAEMAFDYFKIVHQRNSYDDNGSSIDSYVHVRTRDENGNIIDMDNAFWSPDFNAIFYGDGVFWDPWVSLDVSSHELGHGICSASIGNGTGLINNKESGALNEGLSDIWGAAVENWATSDKQTWLCGEDIIQNVGLRSMNDPNTRFQPDTYESPDQNGFWFDVDDCTPDPFLNDNCGIHINSGVLNYWFYLLSVGGSGTNDYGDAFNVDSVGIDKAAHIVYGTETGYMVPDDEFSDLRIKTIEVAKAYYGRCSEEVESVTNAWHAVGVGPEWENPEYDLLMTYDQDCNAVTLTVRDLNTWEPITWVTTNGLLINGNSSPYIGYGGSVTISSPNGLGGVISAIIGDACSTTSFEFCPCLTWDASITWLWSSPMPGEPLQAEVSPLHPEVMKYHWFVNGELIEITEGSGYLSTYNWPCVWDGEGLTVNGITPCGATVLIYGGNYSPLCNYSMASNVNLYPNPASFEVTIALDEAQSSGDQIDKNIPSISLATITQVKLIDKTGMTRKLMNFGKGNTSVHILLSEIQTGVYYLDITDGDRHVIKPLIIKK